MCRRSLIGLLLLAVCWSASAGSREQGQVRPVVEITFDDALELARKQAPAVTTSRARIAEARSGLEAASVWPFNPTLSAAAGPRDEPAGSVVDWSVGVEQRFELGGQRGLRKDAARAGVDAAAARSADARRLLVREVALAFASALYWKHRIQLADENLHLAEDVARIATQRHELGDVGGLDESVAELAVLRAQGRVGRHRAALARAKGRLKALLGIEATAEISCLGDLRGLGVPDPSPVDPGDRPDLRALRAKIRQAEMEARLGRTKRVPDLTVGASFAREESADIVKGALTFTLPVFDRGQGESAIAEARSRRIRSELVQAENTAYAEIYSAREATGELRQAALRFEERGPGLLARAEELATGSYEAGAIPLGELLAVRRELVQAEQDYVDLLYAAAAARIDLAASTGALR